MENADAIAPDFEYRVELTHPERRWEAGVFRLWEQNPANSDEVRLQLRTPFCEVTADADDYFSALNSIRDSLEKEGWRIRCNGCCLNVYPSRMSLQMGGGFLAYRMTMGRAAMNADIVPVFEHDPILVPVPRREQESFYKQWLHSVGNP